MPAEEESTARVTTFMLYKEMREVKELVIEMRADAAVQKATATDHSERIRLLEIAQARMEWVERISYSALGAGIIALVGAIYNVLF